MNLIARTASEGPQLRTILLTDLVDSTSLVERLGDIPASELFREHDRLVLRLQEQWRGRLIDRSDGLLLLFERPIDGLGFALDYARGLHEMGKARGYELQARAGLHVGEVLTWKNSEAAVSVGAKPLEVEGLAKPMAARMMTLARPGQILLSAMAEPLARRAARELGERGEHLLWKSYGRWRFKGIPEPHEIFEVGEVGIAPLRAPANMPKAWRDIPLWRRPAALAAEVVLLVGLGVGVWFVTKPQPAIAFSERDWVVVGDLRNLTGDKVLDDSLAQAFRISLEQSRYVNVLSDMKARDTLARMQRKPGTVLDRAVASEIAIRDGARAVILPTVAEVGGRVRVSAEVIDPHSQTTVYAESVDGVGVGSALASIDKVTATLRGKLGEALAAIERDSAPLPQVTTKNLDALRAYALAQQGFGKGQYAEAKSLYERAVSLDSEFALAYLGLLRSHNATVDLAGGLQHLKKAVSLRAKLPPRDQLYLDAWVAQVHEPDKALEKWRQMAALYPDYFQASANTGYALLAANRYAEGMPYALKASAEQYELTGLSTDLVGLFALGQEQYADAAKAFEKALGMGVRTSIVRLANTYAAQKQFDDARSAWSRAGDIGPDYFDMVSLHLDSGDWKAAEKKAVELNSSLKAGSARSTHALYPSAVVEWMQGNEKEALRQLEALSQKALDTLDKNPGNADAMDLAYVTISAGILAQRMRNTDIPAEIVQRLGARPDLLKSQPVDALFNVLLANQLRLAGKPDAAVLKLKQKMDGSEPFQAHAALLEAYADSKEPQKAVTEAQWLSRSRGRAYAESACGWCQQSLNVVDTTLGHLRAAELLADAGRTAESRTELARFDKSWDSASLPDHLRVRRESVLATFK